MSSLPLKCHCGKIQGEVGEVSANSGKRLVCMCDDCQSYAYQMDRADDILDPSGGTELYQTTLSNITITQGAEHLGCLRLSPKGLMRWYAGCCDTPIANTLPRHKVPFAGVVHSFFDRDALGADGEPVVQPMIVSEAERNTLRERVTRPPAG